MIISIDGACRNNGKPDCISTGAVFIKYNENKTSCLTTHELKSTNQRGELSAFLMALEFIRDHLYEGVNLITDSEYIFKSVQYRWYRAWIRDGWYTKVGDPVKNKDYWMQIAKILDDFDDYTFNIYCIKGHVLSVGKVTARKIFEKDQTGLELYRFLAGKEIKDYVLAPIKKTAREVNGFDLPNDEIIKEIIVCNTVADSVAGVYIEKIKGEEIENGQRNN